MNRAPELAETQDCLCFAARRAARAITRAFDSALKPHGLKSTQFSALSMLLQAGPMPVGALASHLGAERTTLTRILARLEARGLVRIAPGEDARARIVEATAKARDLLRAALPDWRRAQADLSALLSATGADSIRRLARRSMQWGKAAA